MRNVSTIYLSISSTSHCINGHRNLLLLILLLLSSPHRLLRSSGVLGLLGGWKGGWWTPHSWGATVWKREELEGFRDLELCIRLRQLLRGLSNRCWSSGNEFLPLGELLLFLSIFHLGWNGRLLLHWLLRIRISYQHTILLFDKRLL